MRLLPKGVALVEKESVFRVPRTWQTLQLEQDKDEIRQLCLNSDGDRILLALFRPSIAVALHMDGNHGRSNAFMVGSLFRGQYGVFSRGKTCSAMAE